MKKILNLIKCEFIKNYTLKNILIILGFLLLSTIVVSEFAYSTTKKQAYNLESEIDYYQKEYSIALNEKESLEQQFNLNHYQNSIDVYRKLQELESKIYQTSWQLSIGFEIIEMKDKLFVINQMLEHPDEKFSTDGINQDGVNIVEIGTYIGTIYTVKKEYGDNLEEAKEDIQLKLKKCNEMLEKDTYYKFIEYRLEFYDKYGYDGAFTFLDNLIDYENIEFYRTIVSEKIEDENDFRVISRFQSIYATEEIVSKEEYRRGGYAYFEDESYNGYVRRATNLNQLKESSVAIINYSIENSIKHDIGINKEIGLDYGDVYMTPKLAVNQIFHLSVVVMILVILTSGDIISGEHSKRTEKALLTSPIKREKVLFSKFLYLIFHTYAIWLIAFVIIFLYAGIRFGFTELFTPKLIYQNGSVQEVNYILYTLKEIVINGIPVLAMASIVFLLSTSTLSTSLTVGVTMIATVLSPMLWVIIFKLKLIPLVYTPIPYLDFILTKNKSEYYLNTLSYANTSSTLGFIICFITIIICYVASSIVYGKRDIKN